MTTDEKFTLFKLMGISIQRKLVAIIWLLIVLIIILFVFIVFK